MDIVKMLNNINIFSVKNSKEFMYVQRVAIV